MENKKKNCGRKKLPIEEKKIGVTVYVKQSLVFSKGGLNKAKQICISALED